MTPEERGQVKNAYLILLDLIKKYRIEEFGKIGLTRIPIAEIKAIQDLKLETSIKVLANDRVLGPIKKDSGEVLYYCDNQSGLDILVVDCIKTAEEITTYKNSLIIEEGWSSVRIEQKGDCYILSKRDEARQSKKLSAKEGKLILLLMKPENSKKSREEIAKLDNFRDKMQVSNLKNVIRRKLEAIGFSREETEKIMPSYSRGSD